MEKNTHIFQNWDGHKCLKGLKHTLMPALSRALLTLLQKCNAASVIPVSFVTIDGNRSSIFTNVWYGMYGI